MACTWIAKLGESGIGTEKSQLKPKHEEIKTLGLLVLLGEFRRQARDMFDQLVLLRPGRASPRPRPCP